MNFFAVLVFVGIVACVVCEESKKEDVQEAAKELKSDMRIKLKNLAMKSKHAKDYKRQDYYTRRHYGTTTWVPHSEPPYTRRHYGTTWTHPQPHPTWPASTPRSLTLEEYEDKEEESEKMEDFHEGEYPGQKKSN